MILNVLLMDIIKCIIKMSVFLLFQKIQGMILDNQLIDGNNGIAGEVAYVPLFDFLKKREFDNSLENIIQVVATTIVMYNPHLLILTGENIKEDYYFQGLESQIIQRIQL